MRLRLSKLQNHNVEVREIQSKDLPKEQKVVEGVLYYQGLLYIPEIIQSKLINCHHNDPLAGHFGIDKIRELIARNYFWSTFPQDVQTYINGCNIYFDLKVKRHKLYRDFQLLPLLIFRLKDLFIDFVTSLPLSIDQKDNSYNVILVIIDCLIKIMYYNLVKTTIDTVNLAKVIIKVIVRLHSLSKLIINNQSSLLTSKF